MKAFLGWVIVLGTLISGCIPARGPMFNDAMSEYQLGRLEAARVGFEAVLHHYPADAPALYMLGRIHQQRQEYPQARYYYRSCLDADPSFPSAATALAQVESKLGMETKPYIFKP